MKLSIFAAIAGVTIVTIGATAADMPVPHQRSGLWESSMMMMGQNITSQSCIDDATEARMSALSSNLRQKNCSSHQIVHNMDGSWTSISTCSFGGKPRTTHATITGDFNSKLSIIMTTEGSSKPDMTMTETWSGPCKPGMRGGDVITSNGMKMNMLDMTK